MGFADEFISGVQAGQQHKQRQTQQAHEAEDRQIQQAILKHQLDRSKLETLLAEYQAKRQAAGDQFTAQQGQPARPDEMGNPQPNLPVDFPGLPAGVGGGSPGYQQTPQTLEQVMQAKNAEQLRTVSMTPHDLAPGHVLNVPALGNIAAGGPATPPRPPSLEQQYLDAIRQGDTAGAAQIQQALTVKPTGTSQSNPSNVKDVVAGMAEGTLPPLLPGRATKEYTELLAEAHRQGFDLSRAATDWTATQKHIATLNGTQQTRLMQNVNALPELLDSVDALASQWKGGRFPALNRANLIAAKNGVYGDQVASVANQLDSQIADVVSDLASVYMGGNSPTDHSIDLARKGLSGEWSEQVLHDLVAMAKKNVQIRRNSINSTGVAAASPDNPYEPPTPPVGGAPKFEILSVK